MKKVLFALLVFGNLSAFSQVDKMPTDTASLNPKAKPEFIEEMPKYPGGDEALFRLISENLQYPEKAKEADIQGRVVVSFVIEKTGSVTEIKVVQGIGGGCDEEAVRLASLMKDWAPGHQNYKPVRVRMNLPMAFKLESEKKRKRKRS